MTANTNATGRRLSLDESTVDANPFIQLQCWLDDATAAGVSEANAMSVATATRSGRPSSRMIIMRSMDARGLVFYSNLESRKGNELAENPFAALLFYWSGLSRQVRIEGAVERVPDAESDAYFASRPLGHRLAALASRQSTVLSSRAALEQRMAELSVAHPEDVGRPSYWGGYRVVPEVFEFWQSGANRLHDRVRYRRDGGVWIIDRLSP